MDAITHTEAIELFKLPRKLGLTAGGEEITTNVGRFGPYVKYGAKYVSLKTDDPYEITPERALEVIREKEIADANRLIRDFPEAGIQVLNGRYGPYITDKSRNAKIPKDRDPKSLSLEECQSLLAAAPVRTFGKWGRARKALNGKSKPGNGAAANAAAATTAAKGPKAAAAAKKRAPAGAPVAPTALAAKAVKTSASKKAPAAPAEASSAKPAAATKSKRKGKVRAVKKSSAKKQA
jgi:DNA topoisomerase-1